MSRRRLAAGWCWLLVAAGWAGAEDGRQSAAVRPFNNSSESAADAEPAPAAAWDETELFHATVRGRPPEPSAWDKMATGTKSFFSKTYDVLTPWDTEAEKARARRQAAYGGKKKEKKPLFSGWWSEPEKPHQPKTVSQWLAQPRPQ